MTPNKGSFSLGLAQPYENPHLSAAVGFASGQSHLKLDKLTFDAPPSFRSANKWKSDVLTVSSMSYGQSIWRCLRWLVSNDAYVFLGAGVPSPAMPVTFALACLSGRPVLLVSEGLKSNRVSWGLRILLFIASSSAAGQLLAVGNSAHDDYLKAGLAWPARRFGFSEKPYRSPEIKPRVNASGTEKVRLLVVGQLIPRKRIDWLMRALASHPLRSQLTLDICGDGLERQNLQGLAVQLGLEVKFRGFLSGVELSESYLNADIFIHPAAYEGWGVVLNHAAYHGLPILAYKGVRSARDLLVQEGVNGFVFNDDNDFAIRLEQLVRDKNVRRRFSEASKRIGRLWTVEALGAALARLIRNPELDEPGSGPLCVLRDCP